MRTRLRAATAEAHARLHGQPGFARLAAGTIDRDGYAALLARLFGFHAPLDAALAGSGGMVPDGERRRAPALQADLDYLGRDTAALPRCAMLPALRGAEEVLGVLYVVEGATLGGQELARRAGDALFPGVPAPVGRRFLLGHGAAHGAMWRGFCAALEQAGRDGGCPDRMARAADETFRCLERWLGTAGAAAR